MCYAHLSFSVVGTLTLNEFNHLQKQFCETDISLLVLMLYHNALYLSVWKNNFGVISRPLKFSAGRAFVKSGIDQLIAHIYRLNDSESVSG